MASGTKTWVVTSANPRVSHSGQDGEEVPLFTDFSIGMAYPGDPAGGPAETANCACAMDMVIGGRTTRQEPRQFTDREAEKFGQDHWGQYGDELRATGRDDAINVWQSDSENAIPRALRAGERPSITSELDDIIQGAPSLPEPINVTRMIGEDFFSTLEAGTSFDDLSYVATSLGQLEAEAQFGIYVMHIDLPAGMRTMFIDAASANPYGELELLLPRNTRFFIDRIEGADVYAHVAG